MLSICVYQVLRVRRSLGAALSALSAPSAFPFDDRHMDLRPFSFRQFRWVIHVTSVLGVETRRLLVPS